MITFTDDQLARFTASLVSPDNIVPGDIVHQMVINLVESVQARIDFDNTQAIRGYLGGTNDDGSPFIGAWPFWLSRYQAASPAQQLTILAQQPAPPMQEVLDLSGDWPVGMLSSTPLCPRPQVPQVPTGVYIGASLSGGWYAIVLEDRNPAGMLVNFNGQVLERVVYPFGGWWKPAPQGTPITGLPVAQQA